MMILALIVSAITILLLQHSNNKLKHELAHFKLLEENIRLHRNVLNSHLTRVEQTISEFLQDNPQHKQHFSKLISSN